MAIPRWCLGSANPSPHQPFPPSCIYSRGRRQDLVKGQMVRGHFRALANCALVTLTILPLQCVCGGLGKPIGFHYGWIFSNRQNKTPQKTLVKIKVYINLFHPKYLGALFTFSFCPCYLSEDWPWCLKMSKTLLDASESHTLINWL